MMNVPWMLRLLLPITKEKENRKGLPSVPVLSRDIKKHEVSIIFLQEIQVVFFYDWRDNVQPGTLFLKPNTCWEI